AVARLDAMEATLLAPSRSHAVAEGDVGAQTELRFRTSREDYENGVLAAKEAIREGEDFQLVLSLRLDIDCPPAPLDCYRVLRTITPSPYMYYLQLPDADESGDRGTFAVVGSSPETLVKADAGTVVTFPIAGSRPRGATPEEDRALAEELLA